VRKVHFMKLYVRFFSSSCHFFRISFANTECRCVFELVCPFGKQAKCVERETCLSAAGFISLA
jgi:hypothetical protein